MNGSAALALCVIAMFGSFAYIDHNKAQIEISANQLQAECYKAAQANPQLVCKKP